ncbi:RNA ligase [Nocardia sp. NPDC049707]|uniref:RNA ligase n=1 Tax=Nocardia sp. NPDC049707 TaxID=3154735 RepID=UPI003423EBA3
MVHIEQLIDPTLLSDMIEQGYVRVQTHPNYPYRILNYTDQAQYDRVWNEATLQCRGLIIDQNGTVLARPFRKFFNDSEHQGENLPPLDLDAPVEVTDKLDGSLGIGYPTPYGMAIATRGSFTSEQAVWATEFYRYNYAPVFTPRPDLTYLCEIIFPRNRIVVNYGWSDLVLLGGIRTETGEFIPARDLDWPGGKVRQFQYATLREALAAPVRDNAEGFVIRFLDGSDLRVKTKLAEYVRLHHIVTGLSERVVWEHAAAGRSLRELVSDLPDEFHGWVRSVWSTLHMRHSDILSAAQIIRRDIIGTPGLPRSEARKEFALSIADQPDDMKNVLFPMHQLEQEIWKQIRPEGDTRMWNQDDEAAA